MLHNRPIVSSHLECALFLRMICWIWMPRKIRFLCLDQALANLSQGAFIFLLFENFVGFVIVKLPLVGVENVRKIVSNIVEEEEASEIFTAVFPGRENIPSWN